MHYGHLEYSIEPCGEGWQVSFCHSPHGRFHRRLDALRSAVLPPTAAVLPPTAPASCGSAVEVAR